MKKKYSLIVPMINTSSKYANKLPIEFQYDNNTGKMNCIKSIEGINVELFTDIYFVILSEHEKKYNISQKIMLSVKNSKLNGINCVFLFLDTPTSSQAETIYTVIKKYNIDGPIFIKDADNMCICNEHILGNYVLVYPLEKTPIVDPQHKSYIDLDDQQFITNTIEKRVVSDRFNCGGYVFVDSNDFCIAYNSITDYADKDNHLYMSHIIYWLTLYKDIKFRPIECTNYIDFEIE